MTRKLCFAPFCNSRRGKTGNCWFFGVPKKKELFEKWKKVIPRKNRVLEKQDVLCDKHFRDEDVLGFEIFFVNGEEH